jgi:hypothetical protein
MTKEEPTSTAGGSNETIVQLLASYAEQMFDKTGTKDPRRLHSHLKSLSKFYETLNDVSIQNDSGMVADDDEEHDDNNPKTNLTMKKLVELAKDVSDQMIVSKVQV